VSQKICIFCSVGLDASQLNLPASQSKEHVFARWIRDAVTNNRMTMYEGAEGQPLTQLRQAPLSNLVNSRVCKECNNGWMEELESRTDPLAQRLFSGEDISNFSPAELECLSRWTAKTAAVLSFTTPQQKHVSGRACRSIHPSSSIAPQFRFFHSSFSSQIIIEGAYLQLTYAAELPILGTGETSGTRILLVLNNHCFIADFPPILEGYRYDLRNSTASQRWPVIVAAGTTDLGINLPAPVNDVLLAVGHSIKVMLDSRAIRA